MVVAGVAICVLSPVLLVTAAAVRLEDRGPALFRQLRVGRNGTPFRIFKFRSMPVNMGDVPSHEAATLTVTRVGRLIRRTNIDELPQLINVLSGEMSLVGPRPALPEQASLCALRERSGATQCRPGLTGLAQLNSYDGMPEEEKADWDAEYARQISVWGDLKIIIGTFRYLTKRPPVY